MLTERQMFKAGFIARCIEEGHTTPEQITAQVKIARQKLGGFWGNLLASGAKQTGTLAKGLTVGGASALLAAPVVGGYGLGHLAGKARDLDDIDVEEVRKRELIEELQRQTAHLKQRWGEK